MTGLIDGIKDFIRWCFYGKEIDPEALEEFKHLINSDIRHPENWEREYGPEYDARFSLEDIFEFCSGGILPDEANSYNSRFGAEDINFLVGAKCSPEIAEQYSDDISGKVVAIMHKFGILSSSFEDVRLKNFAEILESVHKVDIGEFLSYDSELLGTGYSGTVVLFRGTALKFSKDAKKEAVIISQIYDANADNLVNTIKMYRGSYPGYFKIESIIGDSLEIIISNMAPLDSEINLRISTGILNGLIEMRKAGVFYHCDLRPANILLAEKFDFLKLLHEILCSGMNVDPDEVKYIEPEYMRFKYSDPKIIDFEIATTDRHYMQNVYKGCKGEDSVPDKNRRFGGPNDLVSLGQMMYLMATGEHIFLNKKTGDESESMSRTFGSVADRINDYRTKVYLDESGELLKGHLKQVDDTVEDEGVAFLIKECLTARNYDYGRVKRVFERYRG
ncbi:MAG: hypothetical protein U9R08_01990 [Nanoarchaeota archaeon]|nr:hypothetical protein [Nanoarchaeota archaeon]